jgi:hypothetical protein
LKTVCDVITEKSFEIAVYMYAHGFSECLADTEQIILAHNRELKPFSVEIEYNYATKN